MKKIVCVFPKRTTWTPSGECVFDGYPPHKLVIPPHDEVHISCVFTWDRKFCLDLQYAWQKVTDKPVLVGGPAFESPCAEFVPGRYIKEGVTFTSRGCNNQCPWCGVHRFEGKIRELSISPGNIIQDNNFLQCSRSHKDKVLEMLKGQREISFKGGLQADLIDDHFIDAVRGLNLLEMFIACDTDSAIPQMEKTVAKLKAAGFGQRNIKCYALIGDDMNKNEERLRRIYHAGAMPFAQLYQPFKDKRIEYSDEWKGFATQWSRPAATRSHMEKGTDFRNVPIKQVDGQVAMELDTMGI